MSIILLINYFTWQSNYDGYLALIIKIVSVMLLSNNINYKKFAKYFVLFFSIYSVISLICYFKLLLTPNYINQIEIRDVWGTLLRPTLLYTYPEKAFYRNFGFYSEGGMYAIFLNIALFFSYHLEKKPYIILSRIIIILTIISTLSTTGVIISFLIIILKFLDLKKVNIKNILFSILTISILFVFQLNLNIVSNKLNANNESYTARLSEVSITKEILADNTLLGIGYQNNNAIKHYSSLENLTNGILTTYIYFGIIFGSIIIIIYLLGVLTNDKIKKLDKVILISIYILGAISQPVMFLPLFIVLIFN